MPDAIPALLYALKVRKKASSLPPEQRSTVSFPELVDALDDAQCDADEATIGALLMAVVELARLADVDPETALRAAARRHRDDERAAELAARGDA